MWLTIGCVSVEPKPLHPEATDAAFRARTLADPVLTAYLDEVRPAAPRSWDLETLTLVALFNHPDLDVARGELAAADAAIIFAGARPNPFVSVTSEFVSNAAPDVHPWVFGLSLDIPIETAGKRGFRIEGAQRLGEASRLALADVAWGVRSRMRGALVEHILAASDVEIARRQASIRADAERVIERKLRSGEVSRPDLDSAQIDLAAASLAIRTAEQGFAESRVGLASALGMPVAALEGIEFVWPALSSPPTASECDPLAVQTAGLLNRVDVCKTLAEYAAAESDLQREVARQYPDVHLGPGYTWDQGDHKFGLGLGVELPLLDHNEGGIAAAEARRDLVAARFLALQATIIGDTDLALVRYRSALEQFEETSALLIQLERQERFLKRAVDVGDEDTLSLADIRVQRAVSERANLDALRRVQVALGGLEDVLQVPLPPSTPIPGRPDGFRHRKVERSEL